MKVLTIFLLVLLPLFVQAQDHFYTHFYSNRSFFNPSLTGIEGATTLGIRYKSQWGATQNVAAFKTYSINFEDAMICGPFDLGASLLQDEEGSGMLKTTVGSLKIAGSFLFGKRTALRMGMSAQFGQKRIDLSSLTFADQLDAKYGLFDAFGARNPTSFPFPLNGGVSDWYFNPVGGFSIQHLVNRGRVNRDPSYLLVGGALHNAVQIGREGLFGQEESLLDIGTLIRRRLVVHASYELYTKLGGKRFVAFRPQVVYQRQANLQYVEFGVNARVNNNFGLGAYYHTAARSVENGVNTNWLSIEGEITMIRKLPGGEANRLDLNLGFSTNVSGLRNSLGLLFEVGLSYRFSTSLLCGLRPGGSSSHLSRSKKRACPGGDRNKLYENIWYSDKIL